MILLALLLQAATTPTPAPAARTDQSDAGRYMLAEALKPIEPSVALDTFKAVCWTPLRDPAAFHEAAGHAPIALVPAPRGESAGQEGELYRSDEALLTYMASDSLPASIPSRQCSLRVRLAAGMDQLSLAARLATALGLSTGRTRAGAALSMTQWNVAGADGRTTRLFAVTANSPRGGTNVRLSVLLLGAKQP